MRYPKLQDGEWIFPEKEGFKWACCDCGLVHRLEFVTAPEDASLAFRATRDKRATAAKRRKKPQ